MTPEQIFQMISENTNNNRKYVVITDNENCRQLAKANGAQFFCIKDDYTYSRSKQLLALFSDFDIKILVLCDKCCDKSLFSRKDLIDRIKRGIISCNSIIEVIEA